MFNVRNALFAALLASSSGAVAADWTVVKASGEVAVATTSGGIMTPVTYSSGGEIASNAIVSTGANGRLMIARDGTTIIVNPNTVLKLPSGTNSNFSKVVQQQGSAVFDVNHLPYQHFSVATPYLAVIVKGTKFTVNVGRGSSGVKVQRGLVEVTRLATGEVVSLRAGQSVNVNQSKQSFTVTGKVNTAAANEADTPAYNGDVSVSLNTASGVNAGVNVGGDSGVAAGVSAGGSGGVSTNVSVGGSDGVNAGVSVGGSSGVGVGVSVGGLSLGLSLH